MSPASGECRKIRLLSRTHHGIQRALLVLLNFWFSIIPATRSVIKRADCKLKHVLPRLTTRHTLRVLHIRQSGSDYRRRPDWGVLSGFGKENHVVKESYGGVDFRAIETTGEHILANLPLRDVALVELTSILRELAQWAFRSDGFQHCTCLRLGISRVREGIYRAAYFFAVRSTPMRLSRAFVQ